MADTAGAPRDSLSALIRDTRAYARFLGEQGIGFPMSPPPAPAPAPEAPPEKETGQMELVGDLGASLPADQREAALKRIADEVRDCERCGLCRSRANTVPGEGSPTADLMFIGEGPGADEDRQGRPFVGRAGKKLDEMIAYLGLSREEIFIANIVKCRPPGNRQPTPDEATACRPHLERQIEIIQPSVICLLGSTALKNITGNAKASITRVRGVWTSYRGVMVMPTYHPSYLLRSYTPKNRRDVASDIDAIRERLQELGCKVGDKPTQKNK